MEMFNTFLLLMVNAARIYTVVSNNDGVVTWNATLFISCIFFQSVTHSTTKRIYPLLVLLNKNSAG